MQRLFPCNKQSVTALFGRNLKKRLFQGDSTLITKIITS